MPKSRYRLFCEMHFLRGLMDPLLYKFAVVTNLQLTLKPFFSSFSFQMCLLNVVPLSLLFTLFAFDLCAIVVINFKKNLFKKFPDLNSEEEKIKKWLLPENSSLLYHLNMKIPLSYLDILITIQAVTMKMPSSFASSYCWPGHHY